MIPGEQLPSEAQIVAALRAQWRRVQAAAAYRSGAMIEMRVVLNNKTIKVEVIARATSTADVADPHVR